MRKVINFRTVVIMIATVLSMGMVSCKPTPEEEPDPKPTRTTRAVRYEVILSEDILNLYDVKAITKVGEEISETPIVDPAWFFSATFGEDYPSKVSCEITATAKEPLPEIKGETTTIFIYKYSEAKINYIDGTETNIEPSFIGTSNYETMTISSDKTAEYVAQRPVLKIMNVEYTLK